jgi:N5-(cytidine 5'-diphosphoramidyl)-L-glutamine hydrolase
MTPIFITQRVETIPAYSENRDALDQRWFEFLSECNLLPIIVPNHLAIVREMLKNFKFGGLLMTGGNAVPSTKGCILERDEVELYLLQYAINTNKPVLGVCHGMQVIQHRFDVPLGPVKGHVTPHQIILVNGQPQDVNSYHDWGTIETIPNIEVWALSNDKIVKAIRHKSHPIVGIMWHPERFKTFRKFDIELFKNQFGGNQ